eukprot:PITA_01128
MNCLNSSPMEIKTVEGKKREALWHSMMINKWLLRKTSGKMFNTDQPDRHSQTPETEIDGENVPEISQVVSPTLPHPIGIRSLLSERSTDNTPRVCGISIPSSNRPRPLMLPENIETPWTQYIDTREYKILVTTWNVGGVIPVSDLDLEDCLNLKEESDIYVLGFQEIVPLKAGNVLGSEARGPAEKWETLISKTLNKIPSGSVVTPMCFSAPASPTTPALNHLRRTSYPFPLSKMKRSDYWCSIFPCSCRSSLTNELLDDEAEVVEKPLLHEWFRESRDIQRYSRLASKQMVGIYISVWVRSELRRHIRDIQVSSVACGIMGCLGNKGSVSVRMSLHHTTLCFICTHLAAGEKEGDELRRNSDVSEIMKRTHFPLTTTELFDLPQNIIGHDRIIWFGDLNYRLASASPGITMSMIQKEDWEAILECDQLKMEQAAGRVFEGWVEGSIAFAPTYKYAANSDQYSAFIENRAGHKRRNPAWCDRILWFGNGFRQLSYTSGECRLSDHRPVTAVFLVDVQVLVSHRQIQKRVVKLDDDPRNLSLIL